MKYKFLKFFVLAVLILIGGSFLKPTPTYALCPIGNFVPVLSSDQNTLSITSEFYDCDNPGYPVNVISDTVPTLGQQNEFITGPGEVSFSFNISSLSDGTYSVFINAANTTNPALHTRVTENFTINRHRVLTVSKLGTGTGTVTAPNGGISCGATCSYSYLTGTSVTLTPAPTTGSVFAGWSGDADCSDGTVTMSLSKTCTATFNLAPTSFTVTATGSTGGNATPSTQTTNGNPVEIIVTPSSGFVNASYPAFNPPGCAFDSGRWTSATNYTTGNIEADCNFVFTFTRTVPTGLTATPGDTCVTGIIQINVSWNAVSGATSYQLRDGSTVIYDGSGTWFSHANLTASSSHSYTVRATNASGSSAYSNPVTAIAPAGCATSLPDLTASTPTPTTTVPGAITFSSTISNQGTATTGAGFTNLFQISASSNGSSPTNYTTTTASAVAAGGTTTTSKSLTLVAGTYYMRVCADNNASITESSETNNCSSGTPWTMVTVTGGAINGACATTHNDCLAGDSYNVVDSQRFHLWNCNGLNGGTNANCAEEKQIDLTASAPTPTTATINVARIFTSDISNIRTQSSGTSFSDSFQLATATNGGGTIVTLTPTTTTPALLGNTSRSVNSPSHTFTTIGTYSVRACADIPPVSPGNIDEYSETNNCSPWTDVTVTDNALPDLTASAPTPTTDVVVNVERTYTSAILNQGTASTGTSFSNFFQLSSPWYNEAGATFYDLTSSSMSTLDANGSADVTKLISFNGLGHKSIRVCADKSNSADLGLIAEGSETNNCSPWTNLTVTDVAAMSGTLAAFDCTIPLNGSSCNSNLNWGITNTEAVPSEITSVGMTSIILSTPIIGNSYSGTETYTFTSPASRTFYLYNNAKSLVPTSESPAGSGVIATASCASNTYWDNKIGVCKENPFPVPVVTISASLNPSSGIVPNTPSLTWSATNSPTSCTASGGNWSGSQQTSGTNVPQTQLTTAGTYIYTLTCSNANGPSAPASATVVVTDGSVVNGACSSPAKHYTCSPLSNTSTNNKSYPSKWTWTCPGSNGGADASCLQKRSPGFIEN